MRIFIVVNFLLVSVRYNILGGLDINVINTFLVLVGCIGVVIAFIQDFADLFRLFKGLFDK